MRIVSLLAYVVVMLLFVCPTRAALSAVALKASPRVSTAPITIRFTVIIEPDKNNRKACLAYDGAEAGLSCWQVAGDTHPRTEWFERRIGRAGEYFATLTVVSVVCATNKSSSCDVKHTSAVTQFTVTEPGVPFVR